MVALLASMLQRDPEKRPSIDVLLENDIFARETDVPKPLAHPVQDVEWKVADLRAKFDALVRRFEAHCIVMIHPHLTEMIALEKNRPLH
jgi:hypothetical protein